MPKAELTEKAHEENIDNLLRKLHPEHYQPHYLLSRMLAKAIFPNDKILQDAITFHGIHHATGQRLDWADLQLEALDKGYELHDKTHQLISLFNNVPTIGRYDLLTPAILKKFYESYAVDTKVALLVGLDKLARLKDPATTPQRKKEIASEILKYHADDIHTLDPHFAGILRDESFKELQPEISKKTIDIVKRRFKTRYRVTTEEIRNELEQKGIRALILEDDKGTYSTLEKCCPNIPHLAQSLGKMNLSDLEKKIYRLSDLHRFTIVAPDGVAENGLAHYDNAKAAILEYLERKYPGVAFTKRLITQPTKTGFRATYVQVGKIGGKRMPLEIQIVNETIHLQNEALSPHHLYKGIPLKLAFRLKADVLSEYGKGSLDEVRLRKKLNEKISNLSNLSEIVYNGRTHPIPINYSLLDFLARVDPGVLPYIRQIKLNKRFVGIGTKPDPGIQHSLNILRSRKQVPLSEKLILKARTEETKKILIQMIKDQGNTRKRKK